MAKTVRPRNASGTKPASSASEPSKIAMPQIMAVKLDASDDTPSYYANYVEVTSNMHEYGLYFGQMPSKLSEEVVEAAKELGYLEFPATLNVVLPPTLIDGLIAALQTQKQQYETTMAIIREQQGNA